MAVLGRSMGYPNLDPRLGLPDVRFSASRSDILSVHPEMNAVKLNPNMSELASGAPCVLSGLATEYDATYAGPASCKTVLLGEARLEVEGRSLRLKPGLMVVVGKDVPYRLIIDSTRPVETLSYFWDGLVASDLPWYVTQRSLNAEAFSPRIIGESVDLDDFCHVMSDHVEAESPRIQTGLATCASRDETRADLMAILSEVRNRILACPEGHLTLMALGGEVGLSPFHLQRLYRQVYGLTPNQDQTLQRCRLASRELMRGVSCSDVAMLVGFESPSAFSRAFRREMGVPPSIFARSV